MPIHRFVIYWILDYVIATGVVFVISTAGPSVFGISALSQLSLLYIPIGTMFFSWMAYRGLHRETAHRLVVAGAWVGLALLVDLVIALVVWRVSLQLFLLNPLVLGVYGLKFFSVFIGAYLGLQPLARLEQASPLLQGPRPPAQG